MPIVSDLDAAMMQPAVSVPAVRYLGGGSIRLNDAQRPHHTAGRDAVIYELNTPSGRILALRILLRSDAKREIVMAKRYSALGEDPQLGVLREAGGPLPGSITWIPDGIALPGPALQRVAIPVMAMERVPGRTMARVVDRLCREGQTEPLALLADSWLTTAITIEAASFSHGDLAADNLIVRPDGTIALVDFDTALWPSADLPLTSTEGSPSYVHPRGAPHDPARRDHFAALMIWASLRILARHPGLRERWGDHPDRFGASLFWSPDDLRRPNRSPLFAALDALDDETLHPLLEVVRRAIRFSPDETPPISEIADRLHELGFPRRASAPHPSGRRAGTTITVENETAAAAPDMATARTTTLAERDRHRSAAQKLGSAVAARDVATASRLWEESRAIPEASVHAVAVHHLVSQESAVAIDRALRRGDDPGLVAAVAAAEGAGVAPAPDARRALRAARQRISARTAFKEALERRDYAAVGDLKLRGKLEPLGRLEPGLERVVTRALAWPALERALIGDDDAAIIAAADPALWREEESLPAAAWRRIDLARRRTRWTEDVRAALRQRDGVVLRGLLASAPNDAEQRLTEVEGRRILRVTMREAAVARLERALRDGPDREVVAALAEFETAGGPFSDVLDWTAVRGVVDRISLADALRAAARADPPDTAMLSRLLPAARAALGRSESIGDSSWPELEQIVLRAAHLARLREALAGNDDGRLASAATPDPFGAVQLLSPEEQERVRSALRASQDRRNRTG